MGQSMRHDGHACEQSCLPTLHHVQAKDLLPNKSIRIGKLTLRAYGVFQCIQVLNKSCLVIQRMSYRGTGIFDLKYVIVNETTRS